MPCGTAGGSSTDTCKMADTLEAAVILWIKPDEDDERVGYAMAPAHARNVAALILRAADEAGAKDVWQ